MANQDQYTMDFYLPSAVKYARDEQFNDDFFQNKENDPVFGDVKKAYDDCKGDEKSLAEIREYAAIKDMMNVNSFYQTKEDKNQAHVEINEKQKPVLVIKNLGGTGLNFNIEEGKTVVFDKDAKLTPSQVQELARFFYMQGIETSGLDSFRFDEENKPETQDNQGNSRDFSEYFQENMDNVLLEQQARRQGDGKENLWYGGQPPKSSSQAIVPSAWMMRDKVIARMDIAGEDKSLIETCRCGSGYYVYVYKNEEARDKDGLIDKKGHVSHTKTCGIYVDIINGVPTAQIYTPSGLVDKNTTRYAIEALKAVGCTHVVPPGAMVISGGGLGEFLKNCGKTLMCPRANPPEFVLDAGHINDILEAMNGEKKFSDDEKNRFRAVLGKELQRQCNMEAYKKQYGKYPDADQLREFVAKTGNHPAANSSLDGKRVELQMGPQSDKLKDFTLSKVSSFINKGILGYSESGKWDAVDCIAAVRAYEEFIGEYVENKDTYSAYLPQKGDKLLEIYKSKIGKYKKDVAINIETYLANNQDNGRNGSYTRADAIKDVFDEAKISLNDKIENIKLSYDKFGVWTGFRTVKTYDSDKYFERQAGSREPDLNRYKNPNNYQKPQPQSPTMTYRQWYGSQGR